MKKQKTTKESSLVRPFKLMDRAFSLYKKKLEVFVSIMLLPTILNLFFLCLKADSAITIIISIFISTWAYLAIFLAIRSNGPTEAISLFSQSLKKLPAYIYLNILIAIATIPGIILFGIPTIIYMVWFAFAAYVFINENLKGSNALMRSREYVTGRWWRVAGRVFFVLIFLLAIQLVGILVVQIFNNIVVVASGMENFSTNHEATKTFQVIINNIIALFTVPFSISYTYSLYLNLKKTRPELAKKPVNEKYKWFYIFSPTTVLLFLIVLFGLMIKLATQI